MMHNAASQVASGIGLGSAHVPFRITSVISIPMGDWRASDADLESIGRSSQAHQGHIAAIAPAIDADPVRIRQPLFHQPPDAIHLVFNFSVSHIVLDSSLKF